MIDLEKGEGNGTSSSPYVNANDTDYSYTGTGESYSYSNLKNFDLKAAIGTLSKNQIIFFVLCLVLMVLGILSLFDGIIGIILGILTILLAIFGIAGGFLAQKKLMLVYLVGVGVLLIFTIIDLILDFVFISPFGLIVNLIMAIFYVASGVFGFMIYLTCK